MPFAFTCHFRHILAIGKTFALSLVVLCCLVQPARGDSSLWPQYHACGKQALALGNYPLAERYLIGALQGARNNGVSADDWQMQDLLSDLSNLANQFEKKHNYKESEYIANWRMSVIGKDVRSVSQPTGTGISYSSVEAGSGNGSAIAPSGMPGPSDFAKAQSGGGYVPSGQPQFGGGGDHHGHGHDGCGERDLECLEKAIQYLEKSMNQCAQGINEMNNLAR